MAESELNHVMSNRRILEVANEAARAGAKVLRESFGKTDVQEKSTQNLVTQADFDSEQRIRDVIRAAFPDHTLMEEETEFTGDLLAEHLWVVDPLDGTNNYAHHIPHFCISIAYVESGQVNVGVVYDPMRDEMFSAVRGEGASLNGQTIQVAQPSGLDRSIISTGFYYDRGEMMKKTLGAIESLFTANIRGIRRMGGAALDLSWVACGRFQGFFEYHLMPWDYAAGALLVEEAGGVVRSREGKPWHLDMQSVIAASPTIADDLLKLVTW